MATREELFLTANGMPAFVPRPTIMGAAGTGFGAPTSNAFAWDMWRRDPSRNPALAQATPDDEALEYNRRAHELSQQLLMQENARKAKERVALLQRALQQPNGVNLFQEPANAQDEMLQQIVQGDVDAGTRGWNYGLKGQERNFKQAGEMLSRRIQAQNAAIARAKLQQDAITEQRLRQNDQFRRQYQTALLGQSQQRMQADQGDAIARGYDADARMALEAVRDYGMDPEEAIRVFNIQGSGQQVLRSYGNIAAGEGDDESAQLQEYADLFNEMDMAERGAAAPPPRTGLWNGLMGAIGMGGNAAPAAPVPLTPLQSKEAFERRSEAAKLGIPYDPQRGFFLPPPRSSRAQSPVAVSPTAPAIPQSVQGLPVVSTRAEIERMPRGAWMILNGRRVQKR